jgi:hypothetical protein
MDRSLSVSELAEVAPGAAGKNGFNEVIDGILFAGWEREYKYSVAPTQISTHAPSLTLMRQAKDTSRPVFPEEGFPGSRSTAATTDVV